MDEVRAIRINTPETWQDMAMSLENIQITEEGISIPLEMNYVFREDLDTGIHDSTELQDIRDIVLDECENIYIVDGQKAGIYKYDRFSGITEMVVSCDGNLPVAPESPSGIALDRDTIYIASSPEDRVPSVIAYSRMNFQVKWISSLEEAESIRDITAGPEGKIYVLTEKTVVVLNRGGEVVRSFPLSRKRDPSDIAVSPTGKIFVLDSLEGISIHTFDRDGGYQRLRVPTPYKGFIPSGLSISIDGRLFIGERESPHAFRTIYRIEFSKTPVIIPLWTYRDTTRRLINDRKGNIYIINGAGDKLSVLEYRQVISSDSNGNYRGEYISFCIDSHRMNTPWHRFSMEGEFPEGTRIRFLYRVSDAYMEPPEVFGLQESEWTDALPGDASGQGREKREGLFLNNNKGRYLWFKLILTGTAEASTAVRTLNLYYPRMAYTEMLPALYREDPSSGDFIERFLSIFESLIYETDYEIAHISRYMDALGAPPEYLDWLGRWLSMRFHDLLTAEQKRNLLTRAMELYKMRGTCQGIEEIVRIITGHSPFVVEKISVEDHPGETCEPDELALTWCECQRDTIFGPSPDATVKCGEREIKLSELLYGKDPFSFCVFLKERVTPQLLSVIKEMIEDFKPAHTSASIKELEPWFYLDGHTYLGINTVLNRGVFILEEAVIGRDTILKDLEECAQVSRKARIGIDFNII
ncbi:MAG: hypothetical protein GXO97_02290 [Nitrospirae bacterium]|nr:hypothetical protein [Nitrospirota bacterium]